MVSSTATTLEARAPGDPDDSRKYRHSYLLMRTAVGVVGMVLPVVLALVDWIFVHRGINAKGLPDVDPTTGFGDLLHLRGSISAYYHTGVGDYFVAGLVVVGALLVLYMAGERQNPEFTLSLVAGIALLGVVLFPTARPAQPIPEGDVVPVFACGTTPPVPTDCSPVQSWLGETLAAGVHFFFAAVFIGMLAVLSFVFAQRMPKDEPSKRYRLAQRACGGVIVGAVVWVALGHWWNVEVLGLTPLYAAELVSVWAFATSWALKGESLRASLDGPKRT